jgi:hypothetical protein
MTDFIKTLMDDATAVSARSTLGLGTIATFDSDDYATVSALSSHTHANATTSVHGFMSSTDKTRADGLWETNLNGSEPTGKVAGTLWVDDTTTDDWKLKMWDGADWIILTEINNTANGVTPYIDGAPMTDFGKSLVDDADAAAGRTTLGLGSVATFTQGTGPGEIPTNADVPTVSDASETVKGIIEIATAAEALAGTSTTLALTPSHLASSKSLAGNGYYRFPGGFTIQWGSATATGSVTVTFPIAFTTVYSVVNTTNLELNHWITSLSTSQFTINLGDSTSSNNYWIAVGHKS